MAHVSNVCVKNSKEAEVLMIHHLRLAASFFEATDVALNLPQDDFTHSAMSAWVNAMEALYPDGEQA